MSDQYTPPKPPGYTQPGTEPFRPVRNDMSSSIERDAATGYSTGSLVAIVVVVLAIIAAGVFGYNRSNLPPASNVPAVTINNSNTPAPDATTTAPAATATMPDATAPAPAATATTPDATAAPAATATTPDATVPAPAPDANSAAPVAPANP